MANFETLVVMKSYGCVPLQLVLNYFRDQQSRIQVQKNSTQFWLNSMEKSFTKIFAHGSDDLLEFTVRYRLWATISFELYIELQASFVIHAVAQKLQNIFL